MNLWSGFKNALFRLDPEMAHSVMVRSVRALQDAAPFLLERLSGAHAAPVPKYCPELWGLRFASGLGLAAGFDKNAEIVSALPHLGFGFCEIGTVTPLAQPGNPRPRLLRDAASESLFNRMGFNNDGAMAVARNLESHRRRLPATFRVGVNLGKNKDTSGPDIARDYGKAARPFLDTADFFVVNVSSPNTPGLRALQGREALEPILLAVKTEIERSRRKIPLLVKLAPELPESDLAELIEFFAQLNLDGLVLTNTLAGETTLGTGGWSGAKVKALSQQSLIAARKLTKMPIVSVGGIDSPETAQQRLLDGADLVEIYSAWIFKGPQLPPQISAAL